MKRKSINKGQVISKGKLKKHLWEPWLVDNCKKKTKTKNKKTTENILTNLRRYQQDLPKQK